MRPICRNPVVPFAAMAAPSVFCNKGARKDSSFSLACPLLAKVVGPLREIPMSRYLVVAALLVAACGHPPITPDEKLYFSLEIRQEGRVIGKPKLLGLTNAVARVERRQSGDDEVSRH